MSHHFMCSDRLGTALLQNNSPLLFFFFQMKSVCKVSTTLSLLKMVIIERTFKAIW